MKYIISLFTICFFTINAAFAQTFTLSSPSLGGQMTEKQMYQGFGCKGENVSPELVWENAPEGTKSFAVTMYDPDAPTGSGWWHWVVFDIPATSKGLQAGAGDVTKNMIHKNAIQSMTDYGKKGFGGPCPPEGDGLHAYVITVYALSKETLELNSDVNAATVGFYLNKLSIGKASIIGYYER